MNVQGDLRHNEHFGSQTNLTPEQAGWSRAWPLIRRLQNAESRLKYGFVGLVPKASRRQFRASDRYLPHKEVLCVSLVSMPATKSSKPCRHNRPVRLQGAVVRFHRDEEGRPAVTASGHRQLVFDADLTKHPTQDHPMMRIVDYDPRRGEEKMSYGVSLLGEQATPGIVPIIAPTSGVFSVRQDSTAGWTSYLLDGLPVYRLPTDKLGCVSQKIENNAPVEAGALLADIHGDSPFDYYRLRYVGGKPDLDDHRVLSPITGDCEVQLDELYVNVIVTQGGRSFLIARFHRDDVAAGKVTLMPEREVKGTGRFELGEASRGRSERICLRLGDDWTQLVGKDTTGEQHMIAELAGSVEYGLAKFYKNGNAAWDRVSFFHDIVPASKRDCKLPLRMFGQMLELAKQITCPWMTDSEAPVLRSAEDDWPRPMAVFTARHLEVAGTEKEFLLSKELQQAMLDAVSPKGKFRMIFSCKQAAQQLWKFVGEEDDNSPAVVLLRFAQCDSSGNVAEGAVVQTVPVPKCANLYQSVTDGGLLKHGVAIADWVSRQFYEFSELSEALDNNLAWFTNEFLKQEAIPRPQGDYLLPESWVSCVTTPKHDWVLDMGENRSLEPECRSILLTPLERPNQEVFTWQVNGIHYDVTPSHLVSKRSSRKREHSEAQKEVQQQV
jgi:hypothetical protein